MYTVQEAPITNTEAGTHQADINNQKRQRDPLCDIQEIVISRWLLHSDMKILKTLWEIM